MDALNAVDAAPVNTVTWAFTGNTITATYDGAAGAVANTGNTITLANATVVDGSVTTQGSAANADR